MSDPGDLTRYMADLKALSDDGLLDALAQANPNTYYHVACMAEVRRREWRGQLAALDAQRTAANAETRNAKYMLLSVLAAAVSAIAAAIGVALTVFGSR